MTFSEPMDPASVENPANYSVTETTSRDPNPLDKVFFSFTGNVSESHSGRVRITSATYDPATLTVTLTPARPLKASARYTVSNASTRLAGGKRSAPLIPAGQLTDAAGNPINGIAPMAGGLHPVNGSSPVSGIFSVSVRGTGNGASRTRGLKAGRS